jgi:hypothetical protein
MVTELEQSSLKLKRFLQIIHIHIHKQHIYKCEKLLTILSGNISERYLNPIAYWPGLFVSIDILNLLQTFCSY